MKAKTGRGLRKMVIWLNRISAVTIAVSIVFMLASSVISPAEENRTYTYYKTPIERGQTAFEDTALFTQILEKELEDITRMCVIRNQMETNGVYDGDKIIDITAFANRDEVITDDTEVTAEYYLDDLIKWGNYGFAFETIGNRSELYDRYKTTEGKELEEYASNNSEYKTLVTNLQIASSELFQNYTEYTKYLKEYGKGNTNLVFCYRFVENGKPVYYTNADADFKAMKADDISAMFSKFTKFIAYNPDKMQISTNTGLNAQNLRSILTQYEYSFQDDSRLWVGINNTYSNADIFKTAADMYNQNDPFFLIWVITAIVAAIIFVMTFVFMTKIEKVVVFEGKKAGRMERNDRIGIELYIIAWILAGAAFVIALREFSYYLPVKNEQVYTSAAAFGVFILIFHIIFTALYLCGIRKIRTGRLFKDSIFVWLFKKIKQGALETYDNGHLVSRTWLPYLLFLCLNLVLVLWDVKGILIAFIFDMIVGTWLFMETKSRTDIVDGIEKIKGGDFAHKIDTAHLHGDNLILAKSVNSIGDSIHKAVETSMKDEKMKADLITNVSHDIKTPLTSIINYVDFLKRENIADEKIRGYIQVLDTKSQRLKQLTDDLVEASKISSGNISIQKERINFVEFINQVFGEFAEKFDSRGLKLVKNLPANPVYIKVDSRHIFRVIENLYNNIYKYALEGTRVYLNMDTFVEESTKKARVYLAIKNISAQPLNVSAEELTERFVQGDEARASEGSGLGLSIAKNLTKSLGGDFDLQLDGDLFKVTLTFDVYK
ncbi:MAG: HAMP domain-containing histidine kinase [Lachnospiraceae bacterium]|nr:HAMP domain-containing histidine kinase [Lachnospiraceae bacterium]